MLQDIGEAMLDLLAFSFSHNSGDHSSREALVSCTRDRIVHHPLDMALACLFLRLIPFQSPSRFPSRSTSPSRSRRASDLSSRAGNHLLCLFLLFRKSSGGTLSFQTFDAKVGADTFLLEDCLSAHAKLVCNLICFPSLGSQEEEGSSSKVLDLVFCLADIQRARLTSHCR